MRLVSFQGPGGPRVGGVRDGQFVDLHATDPAVPASLKQLLAQGRPGLARAQAALHAGALIAPQGVRLLAPVPDPEKVICVGLNYADHAAETGSPIPSEPVIFNKFPTALRADGEPIELPALSQQVDFEAELVAVIGTGGRIIPRAQALHHVGGYTCGQDVSARDWQKDKPQRQWLLGKSFDSFAPLGPVLVTPDELGDPHELDICLRRNGQVMQQSNTRNLIFRIEHLIEYVSRVCTLKPGDLIFTGTPPGVGIGRKPPVFLQPGDRTEVEIAGIGTLSNPVVAAG
jgi:2-keto-4-pentenoate hydratase/2-oxohepta-3-ene-1,7-dioic acid hydratase in catechol pathway